ncbi:hypothetical protein [Escherichia coli]|uniref:hypothetical protein n=1 Tax=Escherichia coli TaxID=562 RepID=UPI0013B05002|nr:hypothetical protein [Escherichia coli]
MSFTFDKSAPFPQKFWVDSITGTESKIFSTSGMLNRGGVKILAQEFHTGAKLRGLSQTGVDNGCNPN